MEDTADTPASNGSDEFYDYYDEAMPQVLQQSNDAPYSDSDSGSIDMDLDSDSGSSTPAVLNPKRKFDDELEKSSHEPEEDTTKRRKIVTASKPHEQIYSVEVPATAGKPVEIWQHIFSFCTPDALCLCLRVNKSFNSYLTRMSKSSTSRSKYARHLSITVSENIWTMSRRAFAPVLPRPLSGFTEHAMFTLIGQSFCEKCKTYDTRTASPSSVWDSGPGLAGVRVIWPFAARLCGKCFVEETVTDIELLQTPASRLRLGLPTAFKTADMHYILAPTNKMPSGVPANANPSKIYLREHVSELQKDYEDAQALASGDEWLKGLADLGKSRATDYNRWANWEASLPIGSSLAQTLREYFRPSVRQVAATPALARAIGNSPANPLSLNHALQPQLGHATPSPSVQAFAPPSAAQRHAPPKMRDPQQINEAKAARRSEIERRCREEIQPPLMPNVLHHIESFRNALQITQPLTDNAWKMLMPKLLEQREEAELVEHKRAEQLRALQSTMPDTTNAGSRGSDSMDEHEWATKQAPIRRKLAQYADDFTRIHWQGGQLVTYENSPNFASALLQHVGQQYYDETDAQQKGSATGNTQTEPLYLDNMRWVFDNKVKTITDSLRNDLFVCSECLDYSKAYAFDGMIQHFGSKHTSDFTKGNIIVHWRSAEWPDSPPFVLHPIDIPDPQPLIESRSQTVVSSHEDRVIYFAAVARVIWDSLSDIKDLLDSIKVFTVIHHAAEQYQSLYGTKPDLAIITDALAHQEDMQPIAQADKLACNSCVSANWSESRAYQYYHHRIAMNNLYTFATLLQHFEATHSYQLNWTTDMIEMPENTMVATLLTRPGMDDTKLSIIGKAIPKAFPQPLPHIGTIPDGENTMTHGHSKTSGKKNRSKKNRRYKDTAAEPSRAARESVHVDLDPDTDESERSMPDVQNDEYDPRRPEIAAVSNSLVEHHYGNYQSRYRDSHVSHATGMQTNPNIAEEFWNQSPGHAQQVIQPDPQALLLAQLFQKHPELAKPEVSRYLSPNTPGQYGQQSQQSHPAHLAPIYHESESDEGRQPRRRHNKSSRQAKNRASHHAATRTRERNQELPDVIRREAVVGMSQEEQDRLAALHYGEAPPEPSSLYDPIRAAPVSRRLRTDDSLHPVHHPLHQVHHPLQPVHHPLQPVHHPLHSVNRPMHPVNHPLHPVHQQFEDMPGVSHPAYYQDSNGNVVDLSTGLSLRRVNPHAYQTVPPQGYHMEVPGLRPYPIGYRGEPYVPHSGVVRDDWPEEYYGLG